MLLKKHGCQCNCRPPRNVEVYRPNYHSHYDMDYRKPYPYPQHDMDYRKPYPSPPQDMDYRKPFPYSHHEMDYPQPHPKPKPEMETIVKCGMGMSPGPLCSNGVNVGIAGVNGHQCQSPVANVTLDAGHLEEPIVKIDFSSLISFKSCAYGGGGYFLHLTFKLSKICDGGMPVPLGVWTFEKSQESLRKGSEPVPDGISNEQETDSFCFTWCQCEGCPGCCNYIVELVDQECYNIEFATISNIVITGIASGFKKGY